MSDSAVSYGFLLPTRELVMNQPTPDVSGIIDLAERAEALNFDSVWAGDSILARPRLEAFTTLAAVAARARRVKVGTAVLLPALRHPVVMANEAANLDLLSEGRLILGLGLRPYNASGIPMWIAGSVDNSLRRVARLGDGWYPNPVSPQVFAEQSQQLNGFAREAGRDPQELHRCVYTTLNINDDAAQAERETRAFAEGYYNAPCDVIGRMMSFCYGTPDTCITWLRDLAAAGAQTIVIRFACPDQVGQLERCAADILPQVAP